MPIFPEKRILSNCMARHLHKQDTYITEFDSKLSRFSADLIESFSLDEQSSFFPLKCEENKIKMPAYYEQDINSCIINQSRKENINYSYCVLLIIVLSNNTWSYKKWVHQLFRK